MTLSSFLGLREMMEMRNIFNLHVIQPFLSFSSLIMVIISPFRYAKEKDSPNSLEMSPHLSCNLTDSTSLILYV